ncbi:MAG: hypothetical protein JO339_01845 [Alphaproteobacteria bacterium]|nr:hypothetical protein [Alphaproteobacteria bacterium]
MRARIGPTLKVGSLLALLATLGGCAVAYGTASPAEVTQLRDQRDACLAQNAIRLDDYRSDAATVGRAVVAACSPQNDALIRAIAGPDGYRESEIARQIQQNSQEAATQYVLSHRAAMSVRR